MDGNTLSGYLENTRESHIGPFEVVGKAIEDGIIEPIPDPFAPPVNPFVISFPTFATPNPISMRMLDTMVMSKPIKYAADMDNLELTPELLNTQTNIHTHQFTGGADAIDTILELARFIVPPNTVGTVRSFQNAIAFQDPQYRWPRGNPLWHRSFLAAGVGSFKCDFALRIESLNAENNSPDNYRQLSIPVGGPVLPGNAFSKLPQWIEMAFQWGTDNSVFWVIPPNSVLSFWIICPYVATPVAVGSLSGMFKGYTQPQGSYRALDNLTTSW